MQEGYLLQMIVWVQPDEPHLVKLRNFDPAKDEHPVAWLLKNAKPELFTPLHEWLCSVMGKAVQHPQSLTIPDKWAKFPKHVEPSLQQSRGNNPAPVQDAEVKTVMEIPTLAFTPKLPSDGLPMLGDWLSTAYSIWGLGYERFRETIEFKPVDASRGGQPMDFGVLEVVKGCGRSSILLYSLFYTYLCLQKGLTPEELEDFRK